VANSDGSIAGGQEARPLSAGGSGAGFFDRAALWIAVAIGLSIPVSTALDSFLVAAFLLCWAAGGHYREKWAAIRGNAFALLPCGLFLLYAAGSVYSPGSAGEIVQALDKAARLLLIPLLIALAPDGRWRDRAIHALMAAIALTLLLSFLVWFGLMPDAAFVKGVPADAVVFKKKATHSVLIAFGAFWCALKAREAADPRARLLWALAVVVGASNVLFMVLGRTGYFVLTALLLYYLVSNLGRRGALAAAAVALVVGGTVYFTPSSSLHQRTKTTIAEIQDWQAGKPATPLGNMRLESWSNSLEIARQHPLIGVGTGGFAVAYAKQVEGTSMIAIKQPENQYLLTVVQLGGVGLAALLALFAAQWHLASRLATRADADLTRGLVLAMAVGCMFNSFLLDHTESLLYAWLSGLLLAGLQSRKTRPQ
jgi:O-antigen ligase